MKYAYLTADQQGAIRAEQARRAEPAVPDAALRAAWEADHYAHTLLAESAEDPAERSAHLKAAGVLERALAAAAAQAPADAATAPTPPAPAPTAPTPAR